ncbi:Phosphohistidine phosphatase SixA [Ignavibacterium album JCM 16511]|uniref:Phosphohistidine phosphatase SixA n=1 Tax=Ignavibacterium album (strain DSM 19864 / JCM 16511 / NBRC 101810 / Mat9-16) TaxID=945713 RepID=I0AKJ4_IGNAJ|nr:histidine phosphatase family protein [Ignavibacterium album]AFH49501.1 Phosphohistidine phosphatase SixA [Ignavibacterium album JCM 16511]
MRQLILVRHAKSSWDNPELDDFDRPLNKRGKRDAPFMAILLAEKKVKPDLILSSPAVRTKLTAIEIAKKLGIDKDKIIWNEKIYLASSSKLLKILTGIDDKVRSVMLIGHNPGLTDLQNYLCKEEIDNIPTCGIVCMRTQKDWKSITSKDFELVFFDYPKKYFKKS